MMNKLVLYLARNGYTYDVIRKNQLKSLFVFIVLLLIFGLNWSVLFDAPSMKISVKINNIIWWSLIILQNLLTFLHFKFLKRMLLYRIEYKNQLMKYDQVMVGFKDDKFELGKTYKVCDISNTEPWGTWDLKQNYFLGDILFENGKDYTAIEGDKIFKFISPKENRKLKLEKLKRFNF